jgi:hypothetical protein
VKIDNRFLLIALQKTKHEASKIVNIVSGYVVKHPTTSRVSSDSSGNIRFFKIFNLFLGKFGINRLDHLFNPLNRIQPNNRCGNNLTSQKCSERSTIFTKKPGCCNNSHRNSLLFRKSFNTINNLLFRVTLLICYEYM